MGGVLVIRLGFAGEDIGQVGRELGRLVFALRDILMGLDHLSPGAHAEAERDLGRAGRLGLRFRLSLRRGCASGGCGGRRCDGGRGRGLNDGRLCGGSDGTLDGLGKLAGLLRGRVVEGFQEAGHRVQGAVGVVGGEVRASYMRPLVAVLLQLDGVGAGHLGEDGDEGFAPEAVDQVDEAGGVHILGQHAGVAVLGQLEAGLLRQGVVDLVPPGVLVAGLQLAGNVGGKGGLEDPKPFPDLSVVGRHDGSLLWW